MIRQNVHDDIHSRNLPIIVRLVVDLFLPKVNTEN